MKRLLMLPLLVLVACATTPPKISASLLTAYDGAVAAETAALATGKVSSNQATIMRACRVAANNEVQSVVAAENNGTITTAEQSSAQTSVQAYLAAAQAVANNGTPSGC
jgi:hypothetical protein